MRIKLQIVFFEKNLRCMVHSSYIQKHKQNPDEKKLEVPLYESETEWRESKTERRLIIVHNVEVLKKNQKEKNAE